MRLCLLCLVLSLVSPFAQADGPQADFLRTVSRYLQGDNSANFNLIDTAVFKNDAVLDETLELLASVNRDDLSDTSTRLKKVLEVTSRLAETSPLFANTETYDSIRNRARYLLHTYGADLATQDAVITLYDKLHFWGDKGDFEFLTERARSADHLEKYFTAIIKTLPTLTSQDKSLLARNLSRIKEKSPYRTLLMFKIGALRGDAETYQELFLELSALYKKAVSEMRSTGTITSLSPDAMTFINQTLRQLHENLSSNDIEALEGFEGAVEATSDRYETDFLNRIYHNYDARLFSTLSFYQEFGPKGPSTIVSLAQFRSPQAQEQCELRLETMLPR